MAKKKIIKQSELPSLFDDMEGVKASSKVYKNESKADISTKEKMPYAHFVKDGRVVDMRKIGLAGLHLENYNSITDGNGAPKSNIEYTPGEVVPYDFVVQDNNSLSVEHDKDDRDYHEKKLKWFST